MHAFDRTTGLIEYRRLLDLIAKSMHPDPVDLLDLPGVLGKRRFHPGIGVYTVWEPLTAGDERLLRQLVNTYRETLPPLRPVMHDQDVTDFLNIYRGLAEAPVWEPALRTQRDIDELSSIRKRTRNAHDQAIKEASAQGRMRHLDIDRLPAQPNIQVFTYVPLQDAQAYLTTVALDLEVMLREGEPVSISSEPRRPIPRNSASNADVVLQSQKSGRRRWSEAERRELIDSVGTGQIAYVSEKFGVSEQYVKQLVFRFERKRAASPPHPQADFREQPNKTTRQPKLADSNARLEPQSPAGFSTSILEPQASASFEARVTRPKAHASAATVGAAQSQSRKVILRMKEVEQRIGLKRSSIYARLDPKGKYYDSTFPRPVPLSGKPSPTTADQGKRGSAVGFFQDEIEQWLEARSRR